MVRQAIKVGIKNRTFAYVANAHKDSQGNLILGGPAATTVQFGKDVPTHELDTGEGAFLLSAAYAQQLLTPPAPPKVEVVVPEIAAATGDTQPGQQPSPVFTEEAGKTVVHEPALSTMPEGSPAKPVAPGRGGQRYRLRLQIKPGDFFEVTKALEKLNDRSASMETIVNVIATARTGQSFTANSLHNMVVEPMVEESNVKVLEEQVEE